MKIALLGDICLTGRFDLKSNRDAYEVFEAIRSKLVEYDYVIANLESPFTDLDRSLVCKAIHIKSDPINIELLKYLGVDAVSLANNHIFDYGKHGYRSTVAALKEAGIGHFGTCGQTLQFEKGRERILLGGFCCLSAHPSRANSRGVNALRYSSVQKFFQRARGQNALPILSVHWGEENIHYPSEDHVRLARLLAKRQSYILHGHHPHVVQGVERYKESLLAYSLGNFCTDQHVSRSVKNMVVANSKSNRRSFILGVTIDGGKIVNSKIIPTIDNGRAIDIGGREELDQIDSFSAYLEFHQSLYQRPEPSNSSAYRVPRGSPPRYSILWFVNRMNYQFIGAVAKGIINRFRYKIYFSTIAKEARKVF